MKFELNDAVASPQDLQALIHEVHDYARWYGHNAIKKQAHAKHPTSEQPELTPATKAVLHDWQAKQPLSRSSLDELIRNLERHLHDAPTLTITLAAPPTTDIKKLLTSWCRQNITPNILVRFEFNQGLLGGLVVRYGSHIFDWSFRRQILAERAKFPEVLRRV